MLGKAYPIDPSLIPVFDRTGCVNTDHVLETVVLLELERRRAEITYVRRGDGCEVDFLARSAAGPVELLQVCVDPSRRPAGGIRARFVVCWHSLGM